jgi:hypothetical protein
MIAEAPVATRRRPARVVKGSTRPRLAPPLPVRSDLAGYREAAACLGITLIPWQELAGRYLEAQAPGDRHLYREIATIVARQNGKTKLLLPLIHKRLVAGRRMMHTAQDRYLPREVFTVLADHFYSEHPELFPQRNGRATRPRYANGQEEIRLANGGFYRIFAPTASGARGDSCHDLILDEIRELDSWDMVNAAKHTASLADGQTIYLSNMGDERAVVLNALRRRAGHVPPGSEPVQPDPALAYLEWSADPDAPQDDPRNWALANPTMGHEPEGLEPIADKLAREYRAAAASKDPAAMAGFATELLCLAVPTLLPTLVDAGAWDHLRGPLRRPVQTVMAVAVDPMLRRASAAIAGMQPDGAVGVRVVADVTGSPVNLDAFGPELAAAAARFRVVGPVAFDPVTDLGLARHLRKRKPMQGAEFWNAAAMFVQRVELANLRWQDAEMVAEDLRYTARRVHGSGAFAAVRADDDHTNTAALAVIRAVWLATLPLGAARPEVR